MSGLNKILIIGNCGSDPDQKTFSNGGSLTNISVATSETWKDKDGQQQERTEWHRIVFKNKLSDIAYKYLKKGSKVYVEGSIHTRKWQDKDGSDKYSTEIVAREMQMLDSKASHNEQPEHKPNSNSQGSGREWTSSGHAPIKSPSQAAIESDFSDDIPY